MRFNIAVLPGDGIGPEVTSEAVKVLQAVGHRFGHEFNLEYGLIGGVAIEERGTALPEETLNICRRSDAVLLGAVGHPKWDDPQTKVRPEQGLLALRKGLDLFANLRPVRLFPQLINSTPLRPEVVQGTDLIVVRELTGGIYFGRPSRRWSTSRGRRAVDTLTYKEQEIARVVRVACELARSRRRKLTSVDKANVLSSSRLWREVVNEVTREYPDITVEHVLVDACAMALIRRPTSFDVIVTENMFGDILTDEASVLAGSMGMLPSASLGTRDGHKGIGSGFGQGRTFGLYEPIHGSAPKYAGQDRANPIATILSAAMLLRYSCGLPEEAAAVERAVERVLAGGYRTADIAGEGEQFIGTSAMGSLIAEEVMREVTLVAG